jgi:hypothetical protein
MAENNPSNPQNSNFGSNPSQNYNPPYNPPVNSPNFPQPNYQNNPNQLPSYSNNEINNNFSQNPNQPNQQFVPPSNFASNPDQNLNNNFFTPNSEVPNYNQVNKFPEANSSNQFSNFTSNNFDPNQPNSNLEIAQAQPTFDINNNQPQNISFQPQDYNQPNNNVNNLDPNLQYTSDPNSQYQFNNNLQNNSNISTLEQNQSSFEPQNSPNYYEPVIQNNVLEAPENINQIPGNYPNSFQNQQEFQSENLSVSQQNPAAYSQNEYPIESQVPSNLPEPSTSNTFEEKKSGNKALLTAVIVVVVVLLLVTVGLFAFINYRNKNSQDVTQNSSTSSISSASQFSSEISSSSSSESNLSQSLSSSSNLTSSKGKTPAETAKIRNATSIPASWLQQKFFNNGLKDGACQNQAICGESADPDNDGLVNLDEYNYDIDPLNDDTDNDGISDGNEIKIYLTNPKESDSDNDKVSDGEELVNCYDPISIATSKMSPSKLNNIASNANLYPLRDKTKKTLKAGSGNDTDLENGYIASKCTSSTVEL